MSGGLFPTSPPVIPPWSSPLHLLSVLLLLLFSCMSGGLPEIRRKRRTKSKVKWETKEGHRPRRGDLLGSLSAGQRMMKSLDSSVSTVVTAEFDLWVGRDDVDASPERSKTATVTGFLNSISETSERSTLAPLSSIFFSHHSRRSLSGTLLFTLLTRWRSSVVTKH